MLHLRGVLKKCSISKLKTERGFTFEIKFVKKVIASNLFNYFYDFICTSS